MLPPDQRRAAWAKKSQPKAAKRRAPLGRAKAFSHAEANDVRLTVQDRLMKQYAGRADQLTLEVVEAALVQHGMPESWATSQAPLLHEELGRELKEASNGVQE